jgi:hypothetical protein
LIISELNSCNITHYSREVSKMVVPIEIPEAECLKITDSNDKTDNTGTYEHALILIVFP